jgi:hypothetical protein
MDGAFLDGALASVAGYGAAAALYAGPYGVRSAVAQRRDKRMLSAVLEHDPTHDDSTAFVGRLQTALAERALPLQGLTTAGAARSPEPIRTVCGAVAQQMCPCHVRKELPHGVLRAGAQERERLTQSQPKLQRGRPSSTAQAARRLARKSKQMQENIRAVFQERFVLVKRRLQPSARKPCLHLPRGVPQWRTRRESMEPSDALFDRRCRTQTARGTWHKWRPWVTRLQWIGDTRKKGCAPPLEKALTCLDDQLLPAPANAVERGTRRHRKLHKRVDRVRSQVC